MLNIEYVLKHGNAWLKYKDARYYLRRSYLIVEDMKTTMLVLASITRSRRPDNVLINKRKKRTGFMDEFMELLECEALKHADGVVVENILNEFLPAYFERRGYKSLYMGVYGTKEIPPSYYKFNEET